jgi:hypothetical protein
MPFEHALIQRFEETLRMAIPVKMDINELLQMLQKTNHHKTTT